MTDTLLEVRGLHRSFGGVKALAGCTLDVMDGKINGLIGPNGSGKTTMFNIITGYERCDDGDVIYRGNSIRNRTPEAVFALGIGRTFQLTRIFARLSVLDNMLVATQRRESWLRSMLRPTGSASERDHAMELLDFVGLKRLAGELAGSLSYGQRKLLELAYVLVADPSLILLDEPAGGVNPSLINQLAERITELNRQGTTFLVIEHNMEFVMGLCDAVTVMSYGSVIAAGPPEIVRTDPKVLDAYLGGTEEDDDDDDES
ncbi:ABC transporter ATP-binding protein [Ferrimicrobium acidiphilum]|uniref:Lipopolysaccharide export system ATP-binding protein LptB n=2 Tax=Ferrimicrobium acidiphilum TaxID=121039 RepID=A0A0D8FVG9_9ACTN|nr:ABC transporter ATP-binding protein [Ferrimicrobium acidiphilum]KJE77265.1 lipopolysaccharide export system ATP-binding protein LptB [Ferrimicrobium acidiphilum DSM 19497]MCL5054220.1 ABC transporter ATP-binding protein [Gammaproteobacteria bacterium]